MAEQFTQSLYPEYSDQIHELAKQHLAMRSEPLHLAIAYKPTESNGNVYLFEVIENFGSDYVEPDEELFEVTFGSTPVFPMGGVTELHLTMTNPIEAKVALREQWPSMLKIKDAVTAERFEKLHATPIGEEILGMIRE